VVNKRRRQVSPDLSNRPSRLALPPRPRRASRRGQAGVAAGREGKAASGFRP
jgi:hypothetical protein